MQVIVLCPTELDEFRNDRGVISRHFNCFRSFAGHRHAKALFGGLKLMIDAGEMLCVLRESGVPTSDHESTFEPLIHLLKVLFQRGSDFWIFGFGKSNVSRISGVHLPDNLLMILEELVDIFPCLRRHALRESGELN